MARGTLSKLVIGGMAAASALRVSPVTTTARVASASSMLIPVQRSAAASRLRGGHARALLMSVAAAPAPEVTEKFRLDYKPPPYVIDQISLDFNINEDETLVTATLQVVPGTGAGENVPMDLDGEDVMLRSIEIDGAPLAEGTKSLPLPRYRDVH